MPEAIQGKGGESRVRGIHRPVARPGFGVGALFHRKRTFKHAIIRDSGLFLHAFWETVDFFVGFFKQNISKFVDYFGHFGTMEVGCFPFVLN